jgi:putative nucleotidyltransferase with HDIG domain
MADTKQEAKKIISAETKKLYEQKQMNILELHKVVDLIINDILSSKQNLINMKDLRLKDDNIFSHSVNTATLAAIMTKRMGLRYDKTRSIISGCLLHDIGKILLPQEIAVKREKNMTLDELKIYQTHPRIGCEMIRARDGINPIEKAIILTHHEKLTGDGFPDGLSKNDLDTPSRICAICDVFDNIHNDPARKGFQSTSEAVEYIYSLSNIYFEQDLIKEFLKYIPIYPSGTIILLNNGFLGIVIKNDECNILRPIVKVFYDIINKKKLKQYEIDLMKNLSIRIEGEFKSSIATIMEE